MSAVTTIAATVAAAVGAVALIRYADKKTKSFRDTIGDIRKDAAKRKEGAVLDYEQDPDSGVYKPKGAVKH